MGCKGNEIFCKCKLILLAEFFAGDLDSGYEDEAEEGESDSAGDLVVYKPCVLGDEWGGVSSGFNHVGDDRELTADDGFHVAPWPDLYEGADDEAGEDYHGFFLPAGKESVEEFRESKNSDNRPYEEYDDNQ